MTTAHEIGDFLSPIFLREKKKEGWSLNRRIAYHHFKMNTLSSVIKLLRPNCFMATIDLEDPCYSVRVSEQHQKYLKFY